MKAIASLSAFSLSTLLSLPALAVPGIDFTVTASQWQADYSGEVGQGDNTATLDQLGFDEEDHTVITAVLKHPVPLVPNIRLQRTELAADANGTLEASLEVEGTTFTASEAVATELDLSHTDFTLFYSPLNNWVKLDLGLTARNFDGNAEVVGSTEQAQAEIDGWLPLLYGGVRFELPLTGLYLDGTLNVINYDGSGVTDFTAGIGYITNGLGVDFVAELGLRSFSLKIDDDGEEVEGNIDIDGLYLSLGLKF